MQLLGIVLLGWAVGHLFQSARPIGRDVGDNPVARSLLLDRQGPSSGATDSTLTLVLFTDYQCPACRLAAPAMEAAVASDGHVRILYRDWPIFGPASERAARLALAADRQGIYPPLHRLLMGERRPLDDRVLAEAVVAAGGDWDRVQADLRRYDAAITAQLGRTLDAARRLGLAGTPSYLVGPLLVEGAMDEAGFRRAFAAARDAIASVPGSTGTR
nr:DsbA family protein [Sphingomonas sp. BT553]